MKLFEFKLQRTYENGSVKKTEFQVPAINEMDALVRLGRCHPHDEKNDYELKVLSINEVGVLKAKMARDALVQKILNHPFSEPDWDVRSGGECQTLYEVKNLFTSEEEALNVINRVLDAHAGIVLKQQI